MIKNINDLLLFMITINKFSPNKGVQADRLFSLVVDKYPYIHWDVQTREILEVGMRLKLMKRQGTYILLTQLGKNILSMRTNPIDLNTRQLRYIAEYCVFGNAHFSHLLKFLEMFTFDSLHETLVYNSEDYPTPSDDVEILIQLGILSKVNTVWKINSNYIEHVSKLQHLQKTYGKNKVITQVQLDNLVKEQKEIGDRGEELSMAYEVQRLKQQGMLREASRVVQISINNVSAGYDIASFKEKSISLAHNFFIEVKTRKRNINSFIISANEIQTAKRLREKYAIYFWCGLEYHNPVKPTYIIVDPVTKLNIKECENCLTYIVYIKDNQTTDLMYE